MKDAKQFNRRDFLRTASAATLSALAAGAPRQLLAAATTQTEHGDKKYQRGKATADTVIVLFMAGGMAHTETFDPKRYTPYEKGLESNKVLSTFPSIGTAVDHIKFSQGLEKIGSVMDRGTLIRTYTGPDLGNTTGTPVTLRHRQLPLHTWARLSRALWGQPTRRCLHLLILVNDWMWAKAKS